jgi:hypothetical protein
MVLVTLGALAVGACTGGGGAQPTLDPGRQLLAYERAHEGGHVESMTLTADGKVQMRHGEHLERFTIDAAAVGRIVEALAKPIPTDAPDALPRRTLSLPDRTIAAPRPEPGTVTELLERLLDTHRL